MLSKSRSSLRNWKRSMSQATWPGIGHDLEDRASGASEAAREFLEVALVGEREGLLRPLLAPPMVNFDGCLAPSGGSAPQAVPRHPGQVAGLFLAQEHVPGHRKGRARSRQVTYEPRRVVIRSGLAFVLPYPGLRVPGGTVRYCHFAHIRKDLRLGHCRSPSLRHVQQTALVHQRQGGATHVPEAVSTRRTPTTSRSTRWSRPRASASTTRAGCSAPEINLLGVQALGLGLGTYIHELGPDARSWSATTSGPIRCSIKQALILGLMARRLRGAATSAWPCRRWPISPSSTWTRPAWPWSPPATTRTAGPA